MRFALILHGRNHQIYLIKLKKSANRAVKKRRFSLFIFNEFKSGNAQIATVFDC